MRQGCAKNNTFCCLEEGGGGKRAGAPLEQGGPGRWALSRVQVMAEDARPRRLVPSTFTPRILFHFPTFPGIRVSCSKL